jgi:hypothetical protein
MEYFIWFGWLLSALLVIAVAWIKDADRSGW